MGIVRWRGMRRNYGEDDSANHRDTDRISYLLRHRGNSGSGTGVSCWYSAEHRIIKRSSNQPAANSIDKADENKSERSLAVACVGLHRQANQRDRQNPGSQMQGVPSEETVELARKRRSYQEAEREWNQKNPALKGI